MQTENVVAYHSPKPPSWQQCSKEDADAPNFVFFLPENDARFQTDRKLYWFSSLPAVAMSNAGYWRDADGVMWRLLLKCLIPSDSQCTDVNNFHSVRSHSIQILDKTWF